MISNINNKNKILAILVIFTNNWSKQKEKMNYFVKYIHVNKVREEFINVVFKEDLLELYKEKDLAKKNIKESKIIERL